MARIVSEAQQCQSYSSGHHVHYFAARTREDKHFLPAQVAWDLGTKRILIRAAGYSFVAFHHDPLEIAKACWAVGVDKVSFSPMNFWLKVEMGSNSLKFFNLAENEPGSCLEFC